MRWRHAWIIKRRTFWSLLFQHLPRSFPAVKNGREDTRSFPRHWERALDAFGQKGSSNATHCDVRTWNHGNPWKTEKRIKRIDGTHTRATPVYVLVWPWKRKSHRTWEWRHLLSPQFFVNLCQSLQKQNGFWFFSRLIWSRIHWVRCQNTGKPVDHEA